MEWREPDRKPLERHGNTDLRLFLYACVVEDVPEQGKAVVARVSGTSQTRFIQKDGNKVVGYVEHRPPFP